MKNRTIAKLITAKPTSDGAGVRLRRSLGTEELPILDPFLMLDEFYSDQPQDYIAGFPDHPHRGFETVTYMLAGSLEHKDSVGNTGRLVAGSVQWMTAGRGIIHSEMPKQEHGLMWGFQLWVNLPAKLKMSPPRYQDIPPEKVPEVDVHGAKVRVLAGLLGDVRGPVLGVAVDPTMFDVTVPANGTFEQEVPQGHTAFVYVFEGEARVDGTAVGRHQLAALTDGDRVVVQGGQGARFLLLAGKPIQEPVARYGPFVMNTQAEIRQAIMDFQAGRFAEKA